MARSEQTHARDAFDGPSPAAIAAIVVSWSRSSDTVRAGASCAFRWSGPR